VRGPCADPCAARTRAPAAARCARRARRSCARAAVARGLGPARTAGARGSSAELRRRDGAVAARDGEQVLDLGAGQRPPIALAQAPIGQVADARAAQRLHLEADRGEDAPHFAVLAFVQRDRQRREVVRTLLDAQLRPGGASFGQVHALADRLERLAFDASAHFGPIGLGDSVTRVRDLVREVAVVGEQDQALALLVEPADRVDAALARVGDQVDGARARLALLVGADHALGLVEQVVAVAGQRLDELAFDLDARLLEIDLGAELRHRAAVDRDLPSAISSSHLRREAMPRSARYLLRRTSRPPAASGS
jgi:hypothetical protein